MEVLPFARLFVANPGLQFAHPQTSNIEVVNICQSSLSFFFLRFHAKMCTLSQEDNCTLQ